MLIFSSYDTPAALFFTGVLSYPLNTYVPPMDAVRVSHEQNVINNHNDSYYALNNPMA